MTANPTAPAFSILIPRETVARARGYLEGLKANQIRPGAYLRDRLGVEDVQTLTALDLLGHLFDTKRPQIFAETAVSGDGSDWTLTELRLLGDISIAVPVTILTMAIIDRRQLMCPLFQGC